MIPELRICSVKDVFKATDCKINDDVSTRQALHVPKLTAESK
jgi:hypothetical protein